MFKWAIKANTGYCAGQNWMGYDWDIVWCSIINNKQHISLCVCLFASNLRGLCSKSWILLGGFSAVSSIYIFCVCVHDSKCTASTQLMENMLKTLANVLTRFTLNEWVTLYFDSLLLDILLTLQHVNLLLLKY